MTKEASSTAWTGRVEARSTSAAAATAVCAVFRDKGTLDAALSRLEGSRFPRAELTVSTPGRVGDPEDPVPEAPVREDDARNLRQLGVGTAAAAAALGAAGVATAATGGAALPAVAAAAAAGGGVAAVGTAAGQAAAPEGGTAMHEAAEADGLLLMVRADTAEKRSAAEAILRDCRAERVWCVDAA